LSAAFRNFLIVFLLFLVIFGLLAWKVVVPYIDDVLLGQIDKGGDEETSQTFDGQDTSGDTVVSDRNRVVNFAFIGMANSEHIADIFFVHIDEKKGIYFTTNVPYDTVVDNGGKTAPLYSYLRLRTPAEIIETVPYLVGYDIDYYAVFDFGGLRALVEEMGSITVSFETEVKVYNPDFIDEVQSYLDRGEPVPDAYYDTFGPGDANVDAEHLEAIWNYEVSDDDTDYSLKNSLYDSVFYALTKRTSLATDSEKYLDLMNTAVSTTLGSEAFEEYSDIMFANGYLFKGNYSKKMLYNQSFSKMIVKIREALGDY